MIAKILGSGSGFNAVRYNTDKIDKGLGELMHIENMPYNLDDNISPEEMKNYFKAFSEGNKTKNKQFHATISCEGRELTKEQLTLAAKEYMKKMGYEDQPYIVVFHKDTENNHVHIVSTRVNESNKIVNNSFEKFRSLKAVRELNKELNISRKLDNKLDDLLRYSLSTKNNLKVLLERNGYKVTSNEGSFNIYKNDELIRKIDEGSINLSNQEHINKKQLKAIFRRYSKEKSTSVIPIYAKLSGNRKGEIIGYESELSAYLKDKFGLDIVYHFKDDKPPFGYTLIDNKNKAVLKGSEIYKMEMQLSKFSSIANEVLKGYNISSEAHKEVLSKLYKIEKEEINLNTIEVPANRINITKDLLESHLVNNDFNTIDEIGLICIGTDDGHFIVDTENKTIIPLNDLLPKMQIQGNFTLSIADDVDDELMRGKKNKYRIKV